MGTLDAGARRMAKAVLPAAAQRWLRLGPHRFDSTVPLSRAYGYDRGLPIDRHYIETFLDAHRADVRGHVLEIKEDTYARRFGGARVTAVTVADIDPANPHATRVCDLNRPESLPPDTYDCIILTQTLQYVYELRVALASLAASLKPGGTILATLPGITRIDYEAMGDIWFWSFTFPVTRRLFAEAFSDPEVACHGNLAVATGFLHGLAAHELPPGVLGLIDRDYPVILTVRATRPAEGQRP